MTLAAAALTAEAFRPFGEVICTDGLDGIAVNEGRGLRFNTGLALAHATRATAPTLALYRMQPSPPPVSVALFERHPHSAQLFLPMDARRYLVVVAPRLPQGGPDTHAARAFAARADQGIIYAPGVWHAPLIALDAVSTFAMMMFENADAEDCVMYPLAAPLAVSL